MIKTLILCFFLMFFLDANAQKPLSESEINKLISDSLFNGKLENFRKLKDSVDFYAFALELNIKKKGKYAIMETINTNDSIAYVIYDNFDFLKKINYSSILKERKSATIIIPVGIIISYVNNPTGPIPLLKAEELMPKLAKLFNKDFKKNNQLSKFIYLDPIICLCSTKVYD